MSRKIRPCLVTSKRVNIRRNFFTLIEMVIVITILALFTGVVGINITRALREQNFNTEVGIVLDRLKLAQNLMLVMNRDVDVIVEGKGNEGIEIRLEIEGGLPEQWAPTLKNAQHLLTTIHRFEFEDPSTPRTANQTTIRFFSGGTVMSQGVVRVSTHEDMSTPAAITKVICLRGYPHSIVAVTEKNEKVECPDGNSEQDERLTQFTVEELEREATPDEEDPTQTRAFSDNASSEGLDQLNDTEINEGDFLDQRRP